MKSSNNKAGQRMKPVARKLVTCAVSGFLALSPLLEGRARAQDAPTEQAPPQAKHNVEGLKLTITAGEKELPVYMRHLPPGSQKPVDPVLEVEGPATITVRFYPLLQRQEFSEEVQEFSGLLKYSLEKVGGEQKTDTVELKTRISPYIADEKYFDTQELVICTPKEITLEVPEGKHRFSVLSLGFLELVRVEAVAEKPKPDVPAPEPEKPKTTEPLPVQNEQAPKKEFDKPVVSFDADVTLLNTPGPEENTGDMSYWKSRVYPYWFNDNFGVVVGGKSSSYRLKLDTDTTQTIFRSFSFDASAGLAYWNSGHLAYALLDGGYRGMISTTVLLANNGVPAGMRGTAHQGEIGGQAGYRYKRYIGVDFNGSNNPFGPLGGRVSLMSPLGWVPEDNNPWLEFDLLWLKTMRTIQSAAAAGAAELGTDNIYMRLLAGIPIYPIGPVVPSAIGGGELITPLALAPGAEVTGNFYAGGSLKVRGPLEDDNGYIDVEARGVGNTEGAAIMLRFELSK